MSDDVSLRYRNREVFQLVMGNTIEPVLPYQRQWVAHWTQASSSLSLQSNEHCAATNATKDQIGHCYLPIETMKPSYTCECKNGWRRDLGKQDPTSYMLQSLEAQGGNNGRYTIIMNSVLNRSGFKTLEKLPEHKFPASSINWENIISSLFQNSNSPTSEWTHFPMFDINRKLEIIMAPKKRTSSDTMEAKMNEQLFSLLESPLPPHLREFASEGQYQQQNIAQTDEKMRPCGSVEDLPHYKCHSPNMTSSMQNDEEDDPFCSGLAFKERFAKASLSYLKDNMVCFGSSGTRMKDRSSPCSGYVPHPCVAEECSEERGIACGRNRTTPGLSKSNRMSNCSTSGSRKGESEKFLSGSKHLPITKEFDRDLCRKDKIAGGSTVSSDVKGTAFFEKVTLPAFLHHHGQQEKNLQNLVSSTNNLEDIDGIDTQFMKKENESLVITDPMHRDLHGKPGSPEVGSYFELQKIPQDVVHPDLKRTYIAVTDTSGSESKGALSRKTSNPPAESTQKDSERSLMWVERLWPSSLDPIPLGTKRFKVGDASSSAEMQNLLAKVVNYNRSISEFPECQQIDKTTFLPKSGECSAGDSEKIIPWIRRWCRSSQETASLTPGLCEPENSKVPPEKFEAKQFPSLAAMALMGKQVANFRPCEFRKRGSTTVWKN